MSSHFLIGEATSNDTRAIVALVNSAYRGETSKLGWTTEADLLDGIRTDEESIEQLIRKPGGVILQCRNKEGQLVGCVNLQKQNEQLYLGMLTVAPSLQNAGIGKRLLGAAENYAREHGLGAIVMNVISIRYELISWYERHGYTKTGDIKPFPSADPRFGIPQQPLEFAVLKKVLPNT